MKLSFKQRVIAGITWRLRRLKFLATHEWLRTPPYVLRHAGFDIVYSPGNALAMVYSLNGGYENNVMEYLESSLKPDSVVVDVGANIGFFSLSVLGISKGASVHSFEPSPGTYKLLNASIARNNLTHQVATNQVALYSEPGEMEFRMHNTEYGAYDGFKDTGYAGVGDFTITKVPVTTLDLYAKKVEMRRLDLLKIDAEGAELFVLRGARNVLNSLHPLVLFEVGYQNLRPYSLLPCDLYKFFEGVGYQVMDLHRKPLSEVEFSHASIDEHEFIAAPKSSK